MISAAPTPGHSFCRLLKQHREDLLDPANAEVPACLFLAIDDIGDPYTREKTRSLFGDFVAALRSTLSRRDPAGVRSRLDRVIAFLDLPSGAPLSSVPGDPAGT